MSHLLSSLTLLAAITFAAPRAAAQASLTAATRLLHAPEGRAVATLRANARPSAGATRAGHVEVTIEGWLAARFLGASRDTFPATVKGNGVFLRAAPTTGVIIAELNEGMGLTVVRREGDWALVRRTGWIPARAVAASTVAAVRESSPGSPAAIASAAGPDSGDHVAGMNAILRESPTGRAKATVAQGARVQALHREQGWLRVRIEGWMREDALQPADTSMRAALGPADLRADPAGTRGKLVRWEMQALAFQTADPLQKDMARDEPYVLARGPGSDPSLVYLAIPPSLVEAARSLRPLSPVLVIARVRNGRSNPGGVPILDVVELARR